MAPSSVAMTHRASPAVWFPSPEGKPLEKDGGALLLRRYRHLLPLEQKHAAAAFERLVRGGVLPGLQTGSEARP